MLVLHYLFYTQVNAKYVIRVGFQGKLQIGRQGSVWLSFVVPSSDPRPM